jgi:hypothetical protein
MSPGGTDDNEDCLSVAFRGPLASTTISFEDVLCDSARRPLCKVCQAPTTTTKTTATPTTTITTTTTPTPVFNSSGCPPRWHLWNGCCYHLEGPNSWDRGDEHCKRLNGSPGQHALRGGAFDAWPALWARSKDSHLARRPPQGR